MIDQGRTIVFSIEAGSVKTLRSSMLKNNLEKGKFFKYFDIQQHVDRRGATKWIAFYYDDITEEDIKDLVNVKTRQRK